MSKFKVGDKVKIINASTNDSYWLSRVGQIGEVERIENSPRTWGGLLHPYMITIGNRTNSFPEEHLAPEHTLTKTTSMNLITTFKNITRTEPNKTFVKAGVMNEDLSLTSEGKELFIQFMFDKHATEFKTDVVDAILAEQEKK